MMVVMPNLRCSWQISSRKCVLTLASRAESGSSSSNNPGDNAKARANATRCC
ncbi:Uncharacterised protein [Vibrio cholerae]|nr:Uncharacterised protein [Vibrio cholerae]CSI54811.1 Uncharacterised protein [Vibrio cholerae]